MGGHGALWAARNLHWWLEGAELEGQWRCVCHEKMFEIFSSKGQVIGKVSNWICLVFHIFLRLCAQRFVGGDGLEILQEGTRGRSRVSAWGQTGQDRAGE